MELNEVPRLDRRVDKQRLPVTKAGKYIRRRRSQRERVTEREGGGGIYSVNTRDLTSLAASSVLAAAPTRQSLGSESPRGQPNSPPARSAPLRPALPPTGRAPSHSWVQLSQSHRRSPVEKAPRSTAK